MLRIKIDTDNAAFTDDGTNGSEIARILRKLAADYEMRDVLSGEEISLRDSNGNTVGYATFENEA